jgi:siroheme synthase
VFATAHRGRGAEAVAWNKLVTSHSTLAIYMPGDKYKPLAEQLCEAGLNPHASCAVISHIGRPTQQVRWSNLTSLMLLDELPAPSLLIVGECARPVHGTEQPIQRDVVVDDISSETILRRL